MKNAQLGTVCKKLGCSELTSITKGERWQRKGKQWLFQSGVQPSRPSHALPSSRSTAPGSRAGTGVPRPGPAFPVLCRAPAGVTRRPGTRRAQPPGPGPSRRAALRPGAAAAPRSTAAQPRTELLSAACHRRQRSARGPTPASAPQPGGSAQLCGGNSSPRGGECPALPRVRGAHPWRCPRPCVGPGRPELGGTQPAAGRAGGPSNQTARCFCHRPSAERCLLAAVSPGDMEAEGLCSRQYERGKFTKKHEFTPQLPMWGEDAKENTKVTDTATNTGATRANATRGRVPQCCC